MKTLFLLISAFSIQAMAADYAILRHPTPLRYDAFDKFQYEKLTYPYTDQGLRAKIVSTSSVGKIVQLELKAEGAPDTFKVNVRFYGNFWDDQGWWQEHFLDQLQSDDLVVDLSSCAYKASVKKPLATFQKAQSSLVFKLRVALLNFDCSEKTDWSYSSASDFDLSAYPTLQRGQQIITIYDEVIVPEIDKTPRHPRRQTPFSRYQ